MSDIDNNEVKIEPWIKKKTADTTLDMSAALGKNFIIQQRGDTTLYFDRNKHDKVAIKVRDDCIIGVDKDNRLAIKAIVECVQAKGWTSIKLTGNKHLQVMLAAEAMERGIEVQGFKKPGDKGDVSAEKEAEPEKEASTEKEVEPEKEVQSDNKPGTLTDEKNKKPSQEEIADRKAHPELFGDSAWIDNQPNNAAEEQFHLDIDEAGEQRKEAQQKAHERLNPEKIGDRETAYDTLAREEAVEKYPELVPIYPIVNNARIFLEANRHRFTDKKAQQFVGSVRSACFEDLDKGIDLKNRLETVPKTRGKEQEVGLEV